MPTGLMGWLVSSLLNVVDLNLKFCELAKIGLAIVAFEYPKCVFVVVFVLQKW